MPNKPAKPVPFVTVNQDKKNPNSPNHVFDAAPMPGGRAVFTFDVHSAMSPVLEQVAKDYNAGRIWLRVTIEAFQS